MARAQRRFRWAIAAGWTLFVLLSLAWAWERLEDGVSMQALTSAQLSIDKDILYRRWAAQHGGVYVPVTEGTPPNPNLIHIPERDITTRSGRHLTLVNPAYMTRQVNELAAEQAGVQGHITSLKPLRPENRPDPWEEQVLESFERGAGETVGTEELDGQPILRLMRPFIVEPSCLKCHGSQGYDVGDIRGGISVSVPMEAFLEGLRVQRRDLVLWVGLLWLSGLLGIALMSSRQVKAHRAAARQRAAAAARVVQSETRCRSYVTNAPYGVFIANKLGRYVEVNPEACRITGYSEEELLARSISDMLPEEGLQAGLDSFVQVQETGRTSVELPFRPKTGADRYWVVDAVKLSEDRVLGFVQDITEKKRDAEERELMESRTRHLQKLESIGVLGSGVAHEINNPVNVIMNFGQLIIDDSDSTEDLREYARLIISEGERVATIVRALLAFSRPDITASGREHLGRVVEEVVSLIETLLHEDGIALEIRVTEDLPLVTCHGQKIQQVLMNLLTNARDALNERYPEGSDDKRISIKVSRFDRDDVAWVRTTVEDRAGGIPVELANRIFDPFFSTKPRHKGTGLGLSISHSIVTDLGGVLWLETEPGVCTRFHMDLPVGAS